MLTPANGGIGLNVAHFQSIDPDQRVAMHNVLEPGNPAHSPHEVSVSPTQLLALQASNQAIDDTWQILNYGSGNQSGHVASSQGESFKRTTLAYELQNSLNTGYADPNYHLAFVAAGFQAGNCDHMADVNALLLSASGLHQQVALVHANDVGHAFVAVGDPRQNNEVVISDAWPEFGRALRLQDFALAGQNPQIVRTYDTGYKPEVRAQLLNAEKATQEMVNAQFDRLRPELAGLDNPTLTHALLSNPDMKFYKQQHASSNLGAAYYSHHFHQRIDQSLSVSQFNDRLARSSPPPVDPDLEMLEAGFERFDEDIQMLLDSDPEN